jgi:hypothetical protein
MIIFGAGTGMSRAEESARSNSPKIFFQRQSLNYGFYEKRVSLNQAPSLINPSRRAKIRAFTAFSIALAPLAVLAGISAATMDPNKHLTDKKFFLYGFPSFLIFGSIPAHIYVKDSLLKTGFMVGWKAALYGIYAAGAVGAAITGKVYCHYQDECSLSDNPFPDAWLITANSAAFLIYIFELVDAPFAVGNHDYYGFVEQTSYQRGFYFQPTGWNGEYRLSVGYRF